MTDDSDELELDLTDGLEQPSPPPEQEEPRSMGEPTPPPPPGPVNPFRGIEIYYLDRHGSWTFHPFDGDPKWARLPMEYKRMALEGQIRGATGQTLTGKERQRVVAKLLIDTDSMPPIFDPTADGARTRPYIPGLENHSTVPALIGPKGWGKTKFLCRELAPALIIPGRRFLGHFEPAEMTEEERGRDVWLINAETRPSAVHEELVASGLKFVKRGDVPCYVSEELGLDAGALVVAHLPAEGGSTGFDLTDPSKADWWEARLLRFVGRQPPPLMVIADGVSAMLANDTGRYGAFTSAYKRLLQEAGISNGLGVLHSPMDPRVNTPMNGIESMGEWDGMWIAEADRFPIYPSTARHFRTLPRLGDPEVARGRIVLSGDGSLTFGEPQADPVKATKDAPEKSGGAQAVLDVLTSRGTKWSWTRDVVDTTSYSSSKAALAALVADGLVESRDMQVGRSRGILYRLKSDSEDESVYKSEQG